ncbi:hypothetical protein CTI50_23545 [Pseudomonas syringae pv. actinidiae]|nr:hypothetical protein [Pseudomonas syringae]PIH79764.1 hypothetical protein CTI50_23545 [Pseudomonas syringae pv. actinidiae]
MSSHPAGTCQKKLFSQNDYLAPLPLPTGQQPVDSLNIIWRKNETYLDIGCYSVGSAVMVIWPMMIMFISLAYGLRWKLSPPPDLEHPDIVEWSKSLPPEQWATPSPELLDALAQKAATS